jgi:hypothetical protein
MHDSTTEARLAELEQEKSELIEDKNENIKRITALNSLIQTTPPRFRGSDRYKEATAERMKLVNENAELDSDLREIGLEIRELSQQSSSSGKVSFNHVVSIVAARISSGDQRPIEEITTTALSDIQTIQKTISVCNL